MSRVSRYHDSFNTFINKRSCINDNKDDPVYDKIKEHLVDNDFTLPILMLTITNNQTKKNKVSFLGYYAATAIEFIRILYEITANKDYYLKKYGQEDFNRITNLLIVWSLKSWSQNMDAVKRHLTDDKINKLYSGFINLLYAKVGPNGLLANNPSKYNTSMKNDIQKYYLHKGDADLLDKFKSMKQITKDDMDVFLENKSAKLLEFIVSVGWILGCGQESSLKKVEKVGKAFGMMWCIANDFDNLERDLGRMVDGVSVNYILNCGIQDSYEKFMDSKQQFIEESLNLDIFSSTVKEIVDIVEKKVDVIIDNTSPDLKSTYSTVY